MNSCLSGQTAIISGGAMGIGLAIAEQLHQAGANIVIADPSPERFAAADGLNSDRTLTVDCDVSEASQVEQLVEETIDRFAAVDILVNNAGIYPQAGLLSMEASLFERVLAVNLTGLFLTTQAAARQMVDQGRGGRIINITSIDALHPSMTGLSAYDASKHGAWGFTKNVALELAEHKITVNAIAPGVIETPGLGTIDAARIEQISQSVPLGRLGNPDEVAACALFLASPEAGYITGSQLVIDGGRLLR